jgi:outer membrane protein TolC
MKTAIIVSIFTFGVGCSTFAQLTVEECQAKARANYPLIRQAELIERSKDYNLSNVAKAYLPNITVSAKATYQSDVTEIPVDFSKLGMAGINIPQVNRDQYGMAVDASRTIWDGGSVRRKRATVGAESNVEANELNVALYAVRERVDQLFFGILLCDAMIEQNRLLRDELRRNHTQIAVYIQNGMANRSDLDAVAVEQLNAEQTCVELVYGRRALLKMLSAFTGDVPDENVRLLKPDSAVSASSTIRRPELALFDSRNTVFDAARNELDAALMPKFSLFLTAGYGNPGLNMLKNKFAAYYIGGVRMTWNFGAFYTRDNSRRLIDAGRNALNVRRETFLFNIDLNRTERKTEADKYRELLKSDDAIIALRTSVKRAAELKLAGGTISTADLLREITAEQIAKQNRIIHEIELLKAVYSLKFITNN